ncbi:MAG: LPS export ABC transporter ATP-binding protein [Rhodothermales bacterium]
MSEPHLSQSIAQDLKYVQRLFAEGRAGEAADTIEKLIPKLPGSIPLYVVLAQSYEASGRWREALMTWRDIRQMQPDHPGVKRAIQRILIANATQRMEESRRHSIATGALVPKPRPSDAAPAAEPQPNRHDSQDRDSEDGDDGRLWDRRRGDRRSGDRRRPGGSVNYQGPERRVAERRRGDRRASDAAFDTIAASVQTTGTEPARHAAVALRAAHLTKKYKRREVVSNVSLTVRQGEIVGLLGPNGAGKTTTFYMIVGLVKPEDGRIYIGEKDITNLPMYKRSRNGVGYLAQEASIFTQMSVEDNLHAVLEYQHLSKADRNMRVEELIEEFRLEKVRRSKGYTLSGGERRRTEIARAIASRPKFFLLDEPFAGVDPIAVEDIQEIVGQLKQKGIGVLITDHNVHETLAITDRAYLLYEGKILMQGSAEALASDPEVRKRYLGEKFKLERYI